MLSSALGSELTLTWNDNSDNEDGFIIERSLDGESYEPKGSVEANVSSYLDTTVVADQSYTYRVKAYNEFGNSGYSNTAIGSVASANTPPTIGALSDVSIFEGSSTGEIAFTIGDAETNASELTVSASSSNASLLPNSGIVLGGSGASRAVSLTPALGLSGTATVTLSVSDGNDAVSESFVLTVQSVTPPTIGALSDVSIFEGGSTGEIAFTIGDAETNASELTVSASSSNASLLPNSGIALGGSGSSRTVILTPALGLSGTATVTLSVSDGNDTVSESFVLTVQSVTPPTIGALSDVSIPEGSSTGEIAFTIGDAETNASELTVSASSSNASLLPNSGIALGGSGSSRTVSLTPALGLSGTATVTLSVSDGNDTVSEAFVLTVQSVTVPTIGVFPDQSVYEGETVGPIAFEIGDAETDANDLLVSAYASNGSLLPNGTIVLAGSGANRTITLFPADGIVGTSTVTVTVDNGIDTALSSFSLSTRSGAPLLVRQPSDVTEIMGNATAFSVEATGRPELSYQWQLNGAAIAGATESSYSITEISASDAGEYTVVVSNGDGTVTSAPARLTVESAITEAQRTVLQAIDGFGRTILAVEEAGLNLSYQWYQGVSGDENRPIDGATSASFEPPLLLEDASYWVKVSVESGSAYNIDYAYSNTITISAIGYARFFFGEFNGSKRALGTFGLMVRGDHTAVFIADISNPKSTVTTIDMAVSATGTFRHKSDALGWVEGTIDGEVVSGRVGKKNIAFSGSLSVLDGNTGSIDGFYDALIANISYVQVMIFAGPDGTSYMLSGDSSAMASSDESDAISSSIAEGSSLAWSSEASSSTSSTAAVVDGSGYDVAAQNEFMDVTSSLSNISIRAQIKSGSSVMIAGFVVTGEGQKRVLIRGVGPSLGGMNVKDAVDDTKISLYRQGVEIPLATNDDWGDAENVVDIIQGGEAAGAYPIDNDSKDSALLLSLPSGVYTVHVTSVTGSEGTALVEVYDIDEALETPSDATLANVSLRGEIGTGDHLIIAGFVVAGEMPKRLLIRAMGSELGRYGISQTIADPLLTIYQSIDGEMTPILSNDDWGSDAALLADAAGRAGAFAFDEGSLSAAQVVWLEPGLYTATARSVDGSSGIALVEVYDVP